MSDESSRDCTPYYSGLGDDEEDNIEEGNSSDEPQSQHIESSEEILETEMDENDDPDTKFSSTQVKKNHHPTSDNEEGSEIEKMFDEEYDKQELEEFIKNTENTPKDQNTPIEKNINTDRSQKKTKLENEESIDRSKQTELQKMEHENKNNDSNKHLIIDKKNTIQPNIEKNRNNDKKTTKKDDDKQKSGSVTNVEENAETIAKVEDRKSKQPKTGGSSVSNSKGVADKGGKSKKNNKIKNIKVDSDCEAKISKPNKLDPNNSNLLIRENIKGMCEEYVISDKSTFFIGKAKFSFKHFFPYELKMKKDVVIFGFCVKLVYSELLDSDKKNKIIYKVPNRAQQRYVYTNSNNIDGKANRPAKELPKNNRVTVETTDSTTVEICYWSDDYLKSEKLNLEKMNNKKRKRSSSLNSDEKTEENTSARDSNEKNNSEPEKKRMKTSHTDSKNHGKTHNNQSNGVKSKTSQTLDKLIKMNEDMECDEDELNETNNKMDETTNEGASQNDTNDSEKRVDENDANRSNKSRKEPIVKQNESKSKKNNTDEIKLDEKDVRIDTDKNNINSKSKKKKSKTNTNKRTNRSPSNNDLSKELTKSQHDLIFSQKKRKTETNSLGDSNGFMELDGISDMVTIPKRAIINLIDEISFHQQKSTLLTIKLSSILDLCSKNNIKTS